MIFVPDRYDHRAVECRYDAMTPTSIKYRLQSCVVGDLSQVMAIERAAFPYPWTEGMFLSELSDRRFSFSYIAKDVMSNHVIGYVFMRALLEELHLLNIAVHPSWRKKGVGEALMKRVFETVSKKGMEKVVLEVRVSNRSAINLYRKFGFKQICVRRNYYCHPTENALLLQYECGSGMLTPISQPL